jgi:uncharacterized lipoprotein YbaY
MSSNPIVSAPKNWKLGVYVRNFDVGALVQQVDAGSAAQAAGIVVGDIIVAVSGTRIGEFDGRVVDIADELRRSVDPYGRVSMVIMDSRNKALRATVVTMNSTSSSMNGTVSLSDRAFLPAGSILTVQLQNASKPYFEIAGGKSVLRAEGAGPFAFDLNFDPRYIDNRDQYQLSAFVTANNQIMYSMRQPILVAANSLNQAFNLVVDRGNFVPSSSSVSSIAGLPQPPGTISAASPGYTNLPGATDTAALNQLFVSVLGRPASSREIIAWQSFLQQGNTLNDVTIKLMTSSQYRERFTSDAAYLQQVLQTLTGRAPTQSELTYWTTRMQAVGSPERVIAEIMAQRR